MDKFAGIRNQKAANRISKAGGKGVFLPTISSGRGPPTAQLVSEFGTMYADIVGGVSDVTANDAFSIEYEIFFPAAAVGFAQGVVSTVPSPTTNAQDVHLGTSLTVAQLRSMGTNQSNTIYVDAMNASADIWSQATISKPAGGQGTTVTFTWDSAAASASQVVAQGANAWTSTIFRLFGRSSTDTGIQQPMPAGSSMRNVKFYVNGVLLGDYPMDQDTGPVLENLVPGGADGTITNPNWVPL
jgi:hypothetical protein